MEWLNQFCQATAVFVTAPEQAEHCQPAAEPAAPAAPVTLPAARNGANLDSCGDGSCEVLVSPAAVVPVPDRRY